MPPLATVGVCLELGRYDDAAGALLLFTTNFAAIVVVGCIVFALAGARPHPDQANEARRLRVGFAVAVVALVLIALPLAWGAVESVEAQATALEGAPVVQSWIGERDLEVTDYTIEGDRIQLFLAGSSAPTDVPVLARPAGGDARPHGRPHGRMGATDPGAGGGPGLIVPATGPGPARSKTTPRSRSDT